MGDGPRLAGLFDAHRDGADADAALERVRQRMFVADPTITRVDGEGTPETPGDPELRVGRYLIVETVGVGGMGVVLRAYDPKLGREVALKRLLSSGRARGVARLLAEAQSMAKLSHPNVVSVYDVETRGDDLVIAMEFVSGGDLKAWLSAPRSTPEIFAAFAQAGRGLAAAHEVGLVHRDFKPANVLLDADGTAKVGDFGLARAETPPDVPSKGVVVQVGDAVRTADGVVMGTPRYMAPEQATGLEADARCDQYAFCVALWEALCGEAPFDGPDSRTLTWEKLRGPPRWSGPRSVSRRQVAALRRGLQSDRDRRFPTMNALLLALQPRSAKRWILGAAVASAVALVVVATRPGDDVCSEDRGAVVNGWFEGDRTAVRDHLQSMDISYAQTLADSTESRVDDFVRSWAAAHEEACRPEADQAVDAPLTLACLELGKNRLRATVDGLRSIAAARAGSVNGLLDRLPSLERCTDVARLRASGIKLATPEQRDRLAAVERLVTEAEVATVLADFERSTTLLDEAQERAGEDVERLLRIREARASIAVNQGDYPRAIELSGSAYRDALKGGYLELAVRVGHPYGSLLSMVGGEPEQGMEVLHTVLALAETVGSEDRVRATAQANLGMVLLDLDRSAEGMEAIRKSLAIQAESTDINHYNRAHSLQSLGKALLLAGEHSEGTDAILAAHRIAEEHLGKTHPRTLSLRADGAVPLASVGMQDYPERILREAIASAEALNGAADYTAIIARDNLGTILSTRARVAEARAVLEPSMEVKRDRFGMEHPQTLITRIALARVELLEGRPQQALQEFENIAAVQQPPTLFLLLQLGAAAREVGRLEDAARWLDEGLALAGETLGPSAALRVWLAAERIDLALDLGDAKDAELRAKALWTAVTKPMAPPAIRVPAARVYAEALTEPNLARVIREQGLEACQQLETQPPDCAALTAAP